MKKSYDTGGFILDVESQHPHFFEILDRYCGRESSVRDNRPASIRISLTIRCGSSTDELLRPGNDHIRYEDSLICTKTLTITSFYPDDSCHDQPGLILRPVWCLLFYLNYLPVHGGLVTYKELPIAVLGISGAGKSTLTAALSQRGCEFICDDHFFVRDDNKTLTAIPFVKEFKGSRDKSLQGSLLTTRRYLEISRSMILFPCYVKSLKPTLTSLSTKEGMVRLMKDNLFLETGQPDNHSGQVKLLDLFEKLMQSKLVFELTYNDKELNSACDQVLSFLDRAGNGLTRAASAKEHSQHK